jgi:enoyl-CoA hydratase
MNTITPPEYLTLAVRIEQHVAWVALNRPDKSNAMNDPLWEELQQCFEWIDQEPGIRVAVLCGEGRNFCAGLDFSTLSNAIASMGEMSEPARRSEWLRRWIKRLQGNLTAIEQCRKPVLAAIQGACIGGGIDMICACDMRYCAEGAKFSVKEIDLGIVADVGTLQRLPKLVPAGIVSELALTGRQFDGEEAVRIGLVNRQYPSYEEMIEAVSELAQDIARKSPLAVRGTKEMIRYSRDHSTEDALNYVATWNSAMLCQEDILLTMQAAAGETPDFKN